jgi:hypothetical protein
MQGSDKWPLSIMFPTIFDTVCLVMPKRVAILLLLSPSANKAIMRSRHFSTLLWIITNGKFKFCAEYWKLQVAILLN